MASDNLENASSETTAVDEVSAKDALFGKDSGNNESAVDESGEDSGDDGVKVEGGDKKVDDENIEDEFSEITKELTAEKKEAFDGEIGGLKLKLPPEIKSDAPGVLEYVEVFKKAKEEKDGGAQMLMDYHISKLNEIGGVLREQDTKFREKINRDWIAENKSDPEFGGNKYEATNNKIQAVLRKLLTKDELIGTMEKDGFMGFNEFMRASTSFNYPIMRKLLARMHKHMTEARPVSSNSSDSKKPSFEEMSHKEALFGGIK